jgi:hypothetical protein
MATPVNQIPVTIDYTSRDFYSLRSDLITRIKTVLPGWTGDSGADFGVVMVEAFAYMGDVVSYYIDRVANEGFLATATQRQSILNLSRNYGYVPTGFRAATATVQFINEAESAVVLPSGTQLIATINSGDITFDLIWTLEDSLTVPASVSQNPGVATATAKNYEEVADRPENASGGEEDIAGELLAVSNGFPEQSYRLLENQVVDGSVRIFVQNGDIFEPWTQVLHLTDFGPFDSVFSVITDADDFVTVQFGDGVSGAIPNQLSVIKASYHFGGGSVGNIAVNLITELFKVPGLSDTDVFNLSTTLTLTNTTAGIGGEVPESNESIKEKAPLALTALNRAVSLNDYSALALQVADVGKAKAVGATRTSVTVYVSPQRNEVSVDQFPGYSDNPADGGVLLPEWNGIKEEVVSYFEDKIQIGTSVTVSPPTYVPVVIELFYSKFDQYSEGLLDTVILKALLDEFAYVNIGFGAIIHPEEIEAVIRQIPGIINARVTAVYRAGSTSGRNILIAQPNELFVALSDDIVVTAFSTNATLQSMTFSVGTLSPGFNGNQSAYTLSVPNGTVSTVLTATTSSAGSIMRINDTVTASGATITVNTSVGTTPVSIFITAAEGLTTKTYSIDVIRSA